MSYRVSIRKQALKELQDLPVKESSKIVAAIDNLKEDPRPNGCKKLKGRNGYRVRVGNYRIVYEIFDKTLVVDVIDIGDRKEIYG